MQLRHLVVAVILCCVGVSTSHGSSIKMVVLPVQIHGPLNPHLVLALTNKLSTAAVHGGVAVLDSATVVTRLSRYRKRIERCKSKCNVLKARLLKVRLLASGDVLHLSRDLYQVRLSVVDIHRRKIIAQSETVIFGDLAMLLNAVDETAQKLFEGPNNKRALARYRDVDRYAPVRLNDLKHPYRFVILRTRIVRSYTTKLNDLKLPYVSTGFLRIYSRNGRDFLIGSQPVVITHGPLMLQTGTHLIRFYDSRKHRERVRKVRIRRGKFHTIRL